MARSTRNIGGLTTKHHEGLSMYERRARLWNENVGKILKGTDHCAGLSCISADLDSS